jgi:hypothetical protein
MDEERLFSFSVALLWHGDVPPMRWVRIKGRVVARHALGVPRKTLEIRRFDFFCILIF